MKSEQIENEINTDSKPKVSEEQKEIIIEDEINTDSKKKTNQNEKEIENENIKPNETQNESENKKANEKQNEKQNKKPNKKQNKKQNKVQMNSIFDDFFELPFKISNILKDLSIKEKFEEEKRLSVPNLAEFFNMCEKKRSKWDEIPVTNIQKFFDLCEKTNLNEKKEKENNKVSKKPIKGFSKSYIQTTIYKNGHRIDETQQIIRNEKGEEEIIKEKLVDGKGKKTITKNGQNKVITEQKKLLPEFTYVKRYHPIYNVFDDFDLFEMKPRKIYNNGFFGGFLPMRLLL